MLVTRGLSELNHVFPSQYASPKKREDVAAIWKKIIFEGEGFDANKTGVLKDSLKAYLLTKVQCGGNFVKFCDQFWAEILEPQLKEAQEKNELRKVTDKTIQNVFAMFRVLAKEYIEGDTWGVRDDTGIIEGLNELDRWRFENLSSFVSLAKNFLKTFVNGLKEIVLPWGVLSLASSCSRYRTARQCSVGIGRLAEKWREFSPDQKLAIKNAFDAFKDQTTAAAAQSSKVNVVLRDGAKRIFEVKDLQTLRMASTLFRTAVVTAFFFILIGGVAAAFSVSPILGFFAIPFLLGLACVGAYFAVEHWMGRDVLMSLGSIGLEALIPIVGAVGFMFLKAFSPFNILQVHIVPSLLVLLASLEMFCVLYFIVAVIILLALLSRVQKEEFYRNTYQDNFSLAVVHCLAKMLQFVAEGALSLVDGREPVID